LIIIFENGRLGNQLFQYAGLRSIFPSEKIIFFGFEDLNTLCTTKNTFFISSVSRRQKITLKFIKQAIRAISKLRIFSEITENSENLIDVVKVKRGIFKWVLVANGIFLQNNAIAENLNEAPLIKESILSMAKNWIEERGICHSNPPLAFLHIRRGDYLIWPTKSHPAVLELDWYRNAMQILLDATPGLIFILMGDDKHYLKDFFLESDGLVISENPPEVDMAIMSLCQSGVMSASSFAWWGAFFAKDRSSTKSLFIAPKFWAGRRKKKWFPKNFVSSWIFYID
jgi:hypothetical protein